MDTRPNAHRTLRQRRDAGTLTWRGPALMLFARSVFAVAAQALLAGVFVLRGSPTPWRDTFAWLPVYGTLIDLGCLALLWRLTQREPLRLVDLAGFERSRVGRELLLGLALIPVNLIFILVGVYAAGWWVYGAPQPPYLPGALPLPAALYGVLIWPLLWGLTEQLTYNGYLVARLQVLFGSTAGAVALVAFAWSLQHAFMPLTFEADFMLFRLLSPMPNTLFCLLFYLRWRRLLPLVISHAVLDGTTVFIGALLPLLRA